MMTDESSIGKQMENHAGKMEDFLEQWFDSVHCPLLVCGAQGHILFANVAAAALFGYPAPLLCGMSLEEIEIPENGSRHFQDAVARGIGAGNSVTRKTRQPIDVSVQSIEWRGERSFLYTAFNRTEKQFLLEKTNQYARDLSLFQLFLIGLFDASGENVNAFIAKSLKDFAGAFFVSISDYDRETRSLMHRHIEIDSRLAGKLFHLLGTSLDNLHTPLSDAEYEHVLRTGWSIEKSLYDASFQSVPQSVADALQRWFQIDHFIGISYFYGDRLLGTSLLAMKSGVPDPSIEMLQAFRYAISLFLHTRSMQHEMDELYRTKEFSSAMEIKGRIACSMAFTIQDAVRKILQECDSGEAGPDALKRIREQASEISSLLTQFSDFEP